MTPRARRAQIMLPVAIAFCAYSLIIYRSRTRMLQDRAPDAAFIACPMYEWFKPDSYNYRRAHVHAHGHLDGCVGVGSTTPQQASASHLGSS